MSYKVTETVKVFFPKNIGNVCLVCEAQKENYKI